MKRGRNERYDYIMKTKDDKVNSTVKMSVLMTPEEKEMIADYAEINDLSMSQVVRRAIRAFLESSVDEMKLK